MRRWLGSAAVARKTRYCTGYRGDDGGDGAGDATAVAVAAAAVTTDGGQRQTNQAAACWTERSEARTMDAEQLAAADVAETAPVLKTWAVV
jgi:hypothetical protein